MQICDIINHLVITTNNMVIESSSIHTLLFIWNISELETQEFQSVQFAIVGKSRIWLKILRKRILCLLDSASTILGIAKMKVIL